MLWHYQSHIWKSEIFAGKAGAYQSGAFCGIQLNGMLLNLPANIRLGLKWLLVTNDLAYSVLISAMRALIVKATLCVHV